MHRSADNGIAFEVRSSRSTNGNKAAGVASLAAAAGASLAAAGRTIVLDTSKMNVSGPGALFTIKLIHASPNSDSSVVSGQYGLRSRFTDLSQGGSLTYPREWTRYGGRAPFPRRLKTNNEISSCIYSRNGEINLILELTV